MFELISLGIAVAAGGFGYLQTRTFVRKRLRFVEAARSATAPVLAGLGAAALTTPVTWLPLIGAGTAVAVGLGVGFGVASGAKDIRERRLLE
jgi:hypothetical protein